MPPLNVAFAGGSAGRWSIERLDTVAGSPLAPASRLEVIEDPGAARPAGDAVWVLHGVTSNGRYATAGEHRELAARQEPLGRARATRAALIPVRKSAAWWDLAQDERRRIFEDSSHHIATGLEYLPAVARRLHHGRDLGEPFDFLTWFEFAPEHAAAFEELVRRLRLSRLRDARLRRGLGRAWPDVAVRLLSTRWVRPAALRGLRTLDRQAAQRIEVGEGRDLTLPALAIGGARVRLRPAGIQQQGGCSSGTGQTGAAATAGRREGREGSARHPGHVEGRSGGADRGGIVNGRASQAPCCNVGRCRGLIR